MPYKKLFKTATIKRLYLLLLICFFVQFETVVSAQTIEGKKVDIGPVNLSEHRRSTFIVDNGFIYRINITFEKIVKITKIYPDLTTVKQFQINLMDSKIYRKNIDKRHSHNIDIDKDHIYVNFDKYILKYRFVKKNYKYESYYKIDRRIIDNFIVRDSIFAFYNVYNNHPRSKDDNAYYETYNSITEVTNRTLLDFDFLPWTHVGPSNYICPSPNGFLLSQSMNYKVGIYDVSGNMVDSIVLNDTSHFQPISSKDYKPFSNFKAIAYSPKNHLGKLQSLLKKGSRIWTVNSIDTRTIMVRFSYKDSSRKSGFSFKDDIWRKDESGWTLIKTVDHGHYHTNDLTLTKDNIWPLLLYNSQYVIAEGKIYYFVISSPDKLFNLTLTEFQGLDRMTMDHLKIYTIDFND